jgi:hypothetical protein
MKKLSLLFALALLLSCSVGKKEEGLLKHVVFFKWHETVTDEKIEELVGIFAALPSKIDVIQDLEYGSDVSVEGLQKGFTHCFILTFASEKERDIYLPHPEHQALGKALGPYLNDVMVIDFVVNR